MKAPACALGLGCVTFGREIDAAAARAMLDHAFASDWRHLDTAAVYGGGASEQIVGAWLAERRPAGVTVATKMLLPYEADAIRAGLQAWGLSGRARAGKARCARRRRAAATRARLEAGP